MKTVDVSVGAVYAGNNISDWQIVWRNGRNHVKRFKCVPFYLKKALGRNILVKSVIRFPTEEIKNSKQFWPFLRPILLIHLQMTH